jgi:hypothetical protein
MAPEGEKKMREEPVRGTPSSQQSRFFGALLYALTYHPILEEI